MRTLHAEGQALLTLTKIERIDNNSCIIIRSKGSPLELMG